MTTATQTSPTSPGKAATPAPKPVVEKPIELKDLRRNPEGVVSVDPQVEATQQCTVVSGRKFLGYGGPIAVDDIEGRGTFKCLGDDGLYELSDGGQYVLPHNLAEALGIVIPEPDPAEVAAMAGKLDEYELDLKTKAEEKAKAEYAKDAKAKAADKPVVTPPSQKLE